MTLALRQCGAPTRRGTLCRNPPSGPSGRCHSHTLPARALTASVAKVDMDSVGWKEWKAGGREWQREAWRLYDITGPLRFVANWMGSSVSRCVLYVAEVDESGEPGDRATKPQVAALAAGPLGSGPAKDENLRLLAINNFVAGEAWTVAEAGADEVTGDDGKTTKGDRWFVVSSRQVKRSGDTVVIRRPRLYGGGDMTFRPGEDIILQVWTPHPDNTDEPDSPARSAIPVLRAIEVIWKRIFAELDSRLTGAGVLVMSQNMDFPRGDGTPAGVEGFAQLLMRTMATSMQDRSSAAAVAPIVMTAPPDEIDKLKHLTFWSELSAQLLPLLEAAVRYLAQSLDVPAEILTGTGDIGHWGQWQIEESTVKTQIVPILNRIADALTTGYLKPALEDLGEDPEKYCYAFDTGPLTARPDRSADALSYQQAGIINTDAAIELGALREDQKLEGEERLKWLAEKLVLASPQLVADPVLRELVGFPPAPQAAAQQSSPPPDGGVAAEPVEQPEPEKPEDSPPQRPTVADEQQGEEPAPENPPERAVKEPKPGRKAKATTAAAGHGDALVPVAALATVRALSLAGGRLVPRTRRDEWPDTPRHLLHTRVGPVDVERAGWALRGAWDDLPAVAAELSVDPDGLRDVLHSHVVGLLTSGAGYDPDGLREVVSHLRDRRCGLRALVAAADMDWRAWNGEHPDHPRGPDGQFGGDAPGTVVSVAGTAIRPEFDGLRTAEEVSAAAAASARKLTGRQVGFDLAGSDPVVAAEHASGVLYGLEKFPGTPLVEVRNGHFDDGGAGAYAMTSKDGRTITFSLKAQEGGAAAYRRDVERDQHGHHLVDAEGPLGIALHEVAHAVANGYDLNEAVGSVAYDYATEELGSQSVSAAVMQQISRYAGVSTKEMIAEAFVQVMWDGERASGLARRIVAAMEAGVNKP